MEKKQIKIAKLAVESDGNIIGESFITKPEKDLIPKLGILFGIVEIYNINDNFSHKFLEAISDLKTEFYLPPYGVQSTPEKRFEESLARANRRIFSAFSESIEPIDLRNINIVIGLSRKNEIYLSQIGNSKAFLFHRKKNWEILILDILSNEDKLISKTNPEKIFSSVVSGSIEENDSLLICNEEFLNFFSQNELARTIDQNTPEEALKYLGGQIREKVVKANFYAIAIKPEQKEKLSVSIENISSSKLPTLQSEIPQNSINKLLHTRAETEKYLTPSIMPNWQKFLIISGNFIKKIILFSLSKIKIIIINITKLIKEKINKFLETKKNNKPKLKIETDFSNNNNQLNNTIIENIPETEFKIKSQPLPEETPLKTTIKLPSKNDKTNILKDFSSIKISNLINDTINNQIIKFLSLKLSQRIIFILALILLFLFSQSIVWIGRAEELSSTRISTNNKIAQEIQRLIDNAEAQNIFNDETGAIASIKKAREILEQIPNRWGNKDLRRQLKEKIDSTYYRLQKITILNSPKELINLGDGDYIGLARTTGILWCFDNSTKELIKIEESGTINRFNLKIPEIIKLSAIDDRYLAILTKDNSFYRYEIPKNEAIKTKPGKDYFTVKYPTPSPLLDPPLVASSTIFSISSGEYYYLLDKDNSRIIILDKKGNIKKQYHSEIIKTANSLIANTKNKKLWFLSGSSIYEITTEI